MSQLVFAPARDTYRLVFPSGTDQEGFVNVPSGYKDGGQANYTINLFGDGSDTPERVNTLPVIGVGNDGDVSPTSSKPYDSKSSIVYFNNDNQSQGFYGGVYGIGNNGDVSPKSGDSNGGIGGVIGIGNNGDVSPEAGRVNGQIGGVYGIGNNGDVSPQAGYGNGFLGGVWGVGNNGDVHDKDPNPDDDSFGSIATIGLFNSGRTYRDDPTWISEGYFFSPQNVDGFLLGFNRNGYLQYDTGSAGPEGETATNIDTNFLFDPIMVAYYGDSYTPSGRGYVSPVDGSEVEALDAALLTPYVVTAQATADEQLAAANQAVEDNEVGGEVPTTPGAEILAPVNETLENTPVPGVGEFPLDDTLASVSGYSVLINDYLDTVGVGGDVLVTEVDQFDEEVAETNYYIQAYGLPELPTSVAVLDLVEYVGYLELYAAEESIESVRSITRGVPDASGVIEAVSNGEVGSFSNGLLSSVQPASEIPFVTDEGEAAIGSFIQTQYTLTETYTQFIDEEAQYFSEYVDRNTAYVDQYVAEKQEQYGVQELTVPLDMTLAEFQEAPEDSALHILADAYFDTV